jgi:hypothetical protein
MNETEIEALKRGAGVLYQTLQNVALLHEVDSAEGCTHCTALAGESVAYPCPTIRLVLNDFELTSDDEAETLEPTPEA